MPPWLIAFADMIGRFNAKYGDICWPLLWQSVDRFWHEQMPRILRREEERYDRSITRRLPLGSMGDGPDYEPARPFNYVWWLASTDDPEGLAEKCWWRENFIDNANLIVNKTSVNTFIAGDAPVAAPHQHFASLAVGERGSELSVQPSPGIGGGGPSLTDGGGRGKGTGKKAGKDKQGDPGLKRKQPYEKLGNSFTTDYQGTDICESYNLGKCQSAGNSVRCPKKGVKRSHACSKCGKCGHPSTECSGGQNEAQHVWKQGGKQKKKRWN
jgi:hypothetical protein